MEYSISDIIKITHAKLLNGFEIPKQITKIFFDTRRGRKGGQALFLAIDGKNADGHAYIDAAYKNLSTRNFMVSKEVDISIYPEANFLLVPDVIAALQKLAVYHRQKYQIPVIGITGSNGKTIIKEWIYQICQQQVNIVRSPKSYNSQLGVPLSVLKLEESADVAVFEAGISGKGEMENLAQIIQPTLGIISNLGDAHSAGFPSKASKLAEKLKLFANCECVIYCETDELISEQIIGFHGELISWSDSNRDATYFVDFSNNSILLNGQHFEIPFTDDISRMNAVFAIIAALELGCSPDKKLELKALKMRLEMKAGINDSFLINDAYNSDFEALSSALVILDQQEQKDRNTLILSQIEEISQNKNQALEELSKLIEAHDLDRVITVGEKIKGLETQAELIHFGTTDELLTKLDELEFVRENVLIKGARKYNLERIFEELSIKVHQTILEIDLEAMRFNLQVYRSFLRAETKLMVVLKASGYGSGSKELSRFLAFQRVDYIAVAYVDEGVELRKSGIKLPIMVMNPDEAGFATMIKLGLEPEIYSIEQLQAYVNYLAEGKYAVHLKIETGMHRLGISHHEIEAVVKLLSSYPQVRIQSVFSHLVASDDPDLDSFSLQQITLFDNVYNILCQSLSYRPDRHILNSNGISRFPEHQFEMVRLGIGLHGITDDATLKLQLQKVQKLTTKIAQIKILAEGDSVGYNRKHIASKQEKIGTINIGYADGLPRNAGNDRYSVLVNGKPAPIKGNVCMDMCMVDLSEINAEVGDEVVIFGPGWPIEQLAEACHTIPYEILTRLSTRIHRIFSRE